MNNNIKKFTASLHTHVKSLFDAQIDAQKLCNKIIELGGKGCAITDHGVVSSIEDYRTVFSANNLKMIPGVEAYVDGGVLGRLHLVLLAVDDYGWKGICRLVTDSNKNLQSGFPVMTEKMLETTMEQYRGHIIALSGCVQGVIAAILSQNEKVDTKISKLKEKQTSTSLNPCDAQVSKINEEHAIAIKNLNKALEERDKTKFLAEQKFTKREKAIEKARKNGEDISLLLSELNKDREISANAKKILDSKKNAVEIAKKEKSKMDKKLKEVNSLIDKYLAFDEEINVLKLELKQYNELMDMAFDAARKYKTYFGDGNFYMELQYHRIPKEKEIYPQLVPIAKELNIPFIATNDVHILENNSDERLRRQILRSLRYGDLFKLEQEGDEHLYLKDNFELYDILSEIIEDKNVITEAISNIDVIFDKCNVEFKHGEHYPKFKVGNKTSEEIFDEEIEKGVKWRFPNGMDEEHRKRLEYEVSIIKSMGYVDYHLVVKDFLEYGRLLGFVPPELVEEAPFTIPELKEWIKKNGWKNGGLTIGPGRGSGVGSLACYCLGITALDPLKYGLLFERFLNPERISMPDIDSDLSKGVREKTIQYVQHKYGENAVCGIMTTNAQAPKGAIRIAAKYFGFYKYGTELTSLGDQIAKKVPSDVGISFDSKIQGSSTLYEVLCKEYNNNDDALEILRWAKVVEGSFTAYGAHAAGIVISDNSDIGEYLPLRWNTTLNMWSTQCDMVQVEDNGLLKFDFLGLKTLDVITDALRMIEKNHGIIINPLDIDLNDKTVYGNIIATGKTNSVFQLESDGMKNMLKQFGPDCFEDLILLISMYRPGPLQYLDDVIAVKNNKKARKYLCKELEPILEKTYAAIVYQEQVMEICQKLAGYTLGQADMVRRYMSKKKEDKLAHEREAFVYGDKDRNIIGCVANGINENVANKLFDQMMDFAKYAFNKSHAAAYAFNCFITAWLKCYYPLEFFAAAMNWADNDGIADLMRDASAFGVKVLAPNINESLETFSIVDGAILFGLSSVAGVKKQAQIIINERKKGAFISVKDFYKRTLSNKTVLSNLISAGAFDDFCDNRFAMKGIIEYISDISKKIRDKQSFITSAELVLSQLNKCKSNDDVVKIQLEGNVKTEITELTTASKLEKRIENAKKSLSSYIEEFDMITIPCMIKEDRMTRMNEERELLGIYVTEHPMDYYPSAEELNALPINNVIDGKEQLLYGVITDLEIKNRKSDGKPMAFFKLEDRTGNMDVCVFTQAYAVNKDKIKEGSVVLLAGDCVEEESIFTNENEEPVIIRKFYAKTVKNVSPTKTTYIMSVSSYAVFHTMIEASFKASFSEVCGHPLIIHDLALDEMREMKYKVSEDVLKMANVSELHV